MTEQAEFTCVFLVAAGIASVMRAAAQPPPVEKEILDLEDRMNAIYAGNDLRNYFAFYASDFTQWLLQGRTDLAQYKKEWTAFVHAEDESNPSDFRHARTARP